MLLRSVPEKLATCVQVVNPLPSPSSTWTMPLTEGSMGTIGKLLIWNVWFGIPLLAPINSPCWVTALMAGIVLIRMFVICGGA